MPLRESTKRKWTKIARQFEKTRDINSVMEKFNVSRRTVRIACKEMGVAIEGSVGRPVGVVKSSTYQIIADLVKGVDLQSDIAERHGVSVSRVKAIKRELMANGVMDAMQFVRSSKDKVDELEVTTRWLRGASAVEIADKLDVAPHRVEHVIGRAKAAGLPRAARSFGTAKKPAKRKSQR